MSLPCKCFENFQMLPKVFKVRVREIGPLAPVRMGGKWKTHPLTRRIYLFQFQSHCLSWVWNSTRLVVLGPSPGRYAEFGCPIQAGVRYDYRRTSKCLVLKSLRNCFLSCWAWGVETPGYLMMWEKRKPENPEAEDSLLLNSLHRVLYPAWTTEIGCFRMKFLPIRNSWLSRCSWQAGACSGPLQFEFSTLRRPWLYFRQRTLEFSLG